MSGGGEEEGEGKTMFRVEFLTFSVLPHWVLYYVSLGLLITP